MPPAVTPPGTGKVGLNRWRDELSEDSNPQLLKNGCMQSVFANVLVLEQHYSPRRLCRFGNDDNDYDDERLMQVW